MNGARGTRLIIGIAGASGSGKSLLANRIHAELASELGEAQVGVIAEDSYYRDQAHLGMDERRQTNYDHPAAFEHHLLVAHLTALRQGQWVAIPHYSYLEHTRLPTTTTMQPRPVILLEGTLLLSDPGVRALLDISLYMDIALDICLVRRLERDVQERGRSMDSVLRQYQATVRPMFLQFIAPSKQYADIIVPGGGRNRTAIDMIKARIRQQLTG